MTKLSSKENACSQTFLDTLTSFEKKKSFIIENNNNEQHLELVLSPHTFSNKYCGTAIWCPFNERLKKSMACFLHSSWSFFGKFYWIEIFIILYTFFNFVTIIFFRIHIERLRCRFKVDFILCESHCLMSLHVFFRSLSCWNQYNYNRSFSSNNTENDLARYSYALHYEFVVDFN